MTGPYTGYVIAAYAVAFFLVLGLSLWTAIGASLARRDLARVEAESVRFAGKKPANGELEPGAPV